MAEIVRMPQLSDTMTNGVVVDWHKKIGDEVKSGDLLAEIETDKAVMEFESFQDGILLYMGVKKGETAPVNSILAILGDKGEDISVLLEEEKKSDQKTEVQEKVSSPKIEEEEKEVPVQKNEEKKGSEESDSPKVEEEVRNTHLKISPLAKKMAEEQGINPKNIKGTGDFGRIVKRDIEEYKNGGGKAHVHTNKESFTEEPVSQMRNAIAKKLSASKFSAPHFYLTMEIEMDSLIKAREAMNKTSTAKISFNDLMIKGVAMTLQRHPQVNSSWLGDQIRHNQHIHIGVAIAVEEGLVVPVVRFADGKTLTQIGTEVKGFAEKAKTKKIQPSDWEGNTFTISNLGMYGIDEFTAIINSPDACILAIGGINEKAIIKNGQVVAGNSMKVTLSCDHRVVDGATGASFLQDLKNNLENPVLMLGGSSI